MAVVVHRLIAKDHSGKFMLPSPRSTMIRHHSPELLLLNVLQLSYHHSHFLAATLYFTSFFTMTFLGAAHFSFKAGLD